MWVCEPIEDPAGVVNDQDVAHSGVALVRLCLQALVVEERGSGADRRLRISADGLEERIRSACRGSRVVSSCGENGVFGKKAEARSNFVSTDPIGPWADRR